MLSEVGVTGNSGKSDSSFQSLDKIGGGVSVRDHDNTNVPHHDDDFFLIYCFCGKRETHARSTPSAPKRNVLSKNVASANTSHIIFFEKDKLNIASPLLVCLTSKGSKGAA